MRPIPAWRWTLAALAVFAAVAVGVTIWLLTVAGQAKAGSERATAQLDAVRTGLAAGAGAGAAVGLILAFRRQHHQEVSTIWTDHDAAERRITELYTKAVEQLGSEKAPVRLGGLYALERLAQDNPAQRQTIVNVICAYLRMPFPLSAPANRSGSEPGEDAGDPDRSAERPALTDGDTWRQEKQVRLTAQRVLSEHMIKASPDTEPSAESAIDRFWPGMRLDLTAATLIDFSLNGAVLADAQFTGVAFGGDAVFDGVAFGGDAQFSGANFNGDARFNKMIFKAGAQFSGATFEAGAQFSGATFTDYALFDRATFKAGARFEANFDGDARFDRATFDRGALFGKATFNGDAWFNKVIFKSDAQFGKAHFGRTSGFAEAHFGRTAGFDEATFTGDAQFVQKVTFNGDAQFSGTTFKGDARFSGATFEAGAQFSGATFEAGARFGGATFPSGGEAMSFAGAHVLSPDADHIWPAGWCIGKTGDGEQTVAREGSSASS